MIVVLSRDFIICVIGLAVLSTHVLAKSIQPTQTAASQPHQYLPLLKNKRVGLIVNQTSMVNFSDGETTHLVDYLLSQSIQVSKIFAPEHGFRGDHDAGQQVSSNVDEKTDLPIISIYGKQKKPDAQTLNNIDVLVFDIQDVGARFYTYVSSMFYMMQAASENDIEFIVLDRPNPNIKFVDGPMLEDQFRSFVGLLPVPLLHGMTVAELAKMAVGEGWLAKYSKQPELIKPLKLSIVPVKNYRRADTYSLPIPPSPNLPNDKSIQLYPSLCLFEATPISIGRGTEFPFKVIGYSTTNVGEFLFTPKPVKGAASNPKLNGEKVTGTDLRNSNIQGFDLSLLKAWHDLLVKNDIEFFQYPEFFDKLAGTNQIRKDLKNNQPLVSIREKWQADIVKFKQVRQPYLLYD